MLTRISKIPIFASSTFPSLDLSENRPAQNPMVYLIMFSIIWWPQCEVNPQFSDKATSHFWWYIYIYTHTIYIYTHTHCIYIYGYIDAYIRSSHYVSESCSISHHIPIKWFVKADQFPIFHRFLPLIPMVKSPKPLELHDFWWKRHMTIFSAQPMKTAAFETFIRSGVQGPPGSCGSHHPCDLREPLRRNGPGGRRHDMPTKNVESGVGSYPKWGLYDAWKSCVSENYWNLMGFNKIYKKLWIYLVELIMTSRRDVTGMTGIGFGGIPHSWPQW